jgi:hypothetical protein
VAAQNTNSHKSSIPKEVERYLRDLTLSHSSNPELKVEFACYFTNAADTVDLLEVSPTVLDPGDEEFYAVSLAAPASIPVRQVRITLIAPDEFDRALSHPESRGGKVLEHLRISQDYDVLVGSDSRYARELKRAAQ